MKFLLLIFVSVASAFEPPAIDRYHGHPVTFEHYPRETHWGNTEPCSHAHDMIQCVRDYFHANARCNVVQDGHGMPLFFKGPHNTYAPTVNITFGFGDFTLSNMTARIDTFHINKKSGNLVMTMSFGGIVLDVKNLIITVHRRLQEPIVIRDTLYAVSPVEITAAFPATHITGKTIQDASTFSYYDDLEDYLLVFGPKFTLNRDPTVTVARNKLQATLPDVRVQLQRSVGHYYFMAYLQRYICDFGAPFPRF